MGIGGSEHWSRKIANELRVDFSPEVHNIDRPITNIRSGSRIHGYGATLRRTYTGTDPIFKVEPGGEDISIEGFHFISPTVTEDTVSPDPNEHPFCIDLGDWANGGEGSQRCHVSNIYFGEGIMKGIYSGGGNATIEDVRGTPAHTGIEADTNGNTLALYNVNLNVPWHGAGSAMRAWQLANGTAYLFKRVDHLHLTSCFAYGYNYGSRFSKGTIPSFLGGAGGSWEGGGFDGCNNACQIDQLRADIGEDDGGNGGFFRFTGVAFIGDVKALRINSPSGIDNNAELEYESRIFLTNCKIHSTLGANPPAVLLTKGRLHMVNCEFVNPGDSSGRNHFLTVTNGVVTMHGGEVQGVAGSLAINLTSGCRKADIGGVIGLGGSGRITNNATASRIDANMLTPDYVA